MIFMPTKDISLYPNHVKENKQGSPYYQFHIANTGYHWLEKATGQFRSKLDMFLKFGKFPKILLNLTTGYNKDYERKEKPDYKDGKYIGE